jgi:UDP-N-acetyl-D-mannosaminuronic acid dehydrogenase
MNIKKYLKNIKYVQFNKTIAEFASGSIFDNQKYHITNTCAVLKNKKLIGSLSFGDIKRKFNNIDKTFPVSKIMNKKPIIIKFNTDEFIFFRNLKKIVLHNDIEFVYVVDKNGCLLGVIDSNIVSNFNDSMFCDTIIFGLGFVGLTLMIHLAKYNIRVTGIDKNKKIISNLKNNNTSINENGLVQILRLGNKRKSLLFYTKYPKKNLAKIFIVTVGTPVKNLKININYVEQCLKDISEILTINSLVILRSTIPVGSSRSKFIPLIEKKTQLKCGLDWNFVFAPERTVEGNALNELNSLPQILSGYTPECLNKGKQYFANFTNNIIEMDTLEMAELSKLICNTYRDLTFAFANDTALLSEKYNINAHNLINLTNEGYPRGGIPLPSPGVGGTCLSKDPYLYSLSNISDNFHKSKLGLISREINIKSAKVPEKVFKNYKRKINKKIITVLILGLSFKGDFPNKDIRNSNAKKFADFCIKNNCDTYIFDPFFKKSEIVGQGYKYYNFNKPVNKNIDCIFVLNNTDIFKNINIRDWLQSSGFKIFFDGWNLFPELNIQNNNFVYTTMGKLK